MAVPARCLPIADSFTRSSLSDAELPPRPLARATPIADAFSRLNWAESDSWTPSRGHFLRSPSPLQQFVLNPLASRACLPFGPFWSRDPEPIHITGVTIDRQPSPLQQAERGHSDLHRRAAELAANYHARHNIRQIDELPVYQRREQQVINNLPPPYAELDPLRPPTIPTIPSRTSSLTRRPSRSHSLSQLFSPRPTLSIPSSAEEASRYPKASSSLTRIYRPKFAVDKPRQPFVQLSALMSPAKAFLINKPFTGSFHPLPNCSCSTTKYPQIALAVYARYDLRSKRVWLAVQQIWTTASELGRQEEIKWMRFDAFVAREVDGVKVPGRQVFMPWSQFCREDGELCEDRLRRKWYEHNVRGTKGFSGVDEV